MPHSSRRHALQSVGGVLLAAIAGCNGSNSSSRSVPREVRDVVDELTVLKVRNTSPKPMVMRRRDQTTENGTTEAPPGRRGNLMDHVTEPPRKDEHAIAFQTDVPGASDIETFFEETDFETESIYLAQSTIPECYERHLTGVYREGNGVDVQFCRTARPADVECSADAHDMTAFAIRLPFPGDDFNSVGGGHSSGCGGPRRSIIEPDISRTIGGDGGADE